MLGLLPVVAHGVAHRVERGLSRGGPSIDAHKVQAQPRAPLRPRPLGLRIEAVDERGPEALGELGHASTAEASAAGEGVPEAVGIGPALQEPEELAGAQQGMDAMVKGFKDMAAGPGKDGLAAACKSALDATKQSMGPMGCEF